MSEAQPPYLSPDGLWRWDGAQWVPNHGAPQQHPPYPQAAPAPTGWANRPQPYPAAAAVTGRPVRPQPPRSLAYQFGGSAIWSIVFGAVSLATALLTPVYFRFMPLVGIWRGVVAIRAGRLAGGIIGTALSVVGLVASMYVSGIFTSSVP